MDQLLYAFYQAITSERTFETKAIFFIILLIAITMHEFGHAFAADKLKDPLPRLQGRVTLNPLAHADPIGTLLLPAVMIFTGSPIMFGWGKPVQVSLPNPKTRMRDDLLSTFAGPLVNLILAIISAYLFVFAYAKNIDALMFASSTSLLINTMLMVFNMLPVPPLDGSHFLRYLLKMSHETYIKFSQYGFVALLLLIWLTPAGEYLGMAIFKTAMFLLENIALICSSAKGA